MSFVRVIIYNHMTNGQPVYQLIFCKQHVALDQGEVSHNTEHYNVRPVLYVKGD